jgi:hypothetical protein
MVPSTKGFGPEKDCTGKGQQHIQKTDPSSRQRGRPPTQDRNRQTVINRWSWAPDGARHQDLLTDWPSVAMWLWLEQSRGIITRVEAGSNNSTVTLRDGGGDKKGSLKSETVKYGLKSLGTTTGKDCAGKASGTYKRQTRPLVREGVPRNEERNCQTYSVFRTEKISGDKPQTWLDTKTYWLTDRQSQCDFDFDLNRGEFAGRVL